MLGTVTVQPDSRTVANRPKMDHLEPASECRRGENDGAGIFKVLTRSGLCGPFLKAKYMPMSRQTR